MKIAFDKLVDEAMRVHAVGVEAFYARFDPDPWAASFAEIEGLIQPGYSDRLLTQAIAVLKARREKMVALYREFQLVQGKDFRGEAAEIEKEFRANEQARRGGLRCDGCGASIWKAKALRAKLFQEQRDEQEHSIIRTACPACARANS